MSKPAAKKSAKADDEETIEEFLFDLAFQANPTRFYPFPDEYRSKNTTADQLGDRFKPYSSEEFAKLSADLQKLKADPDMAGSSIACPRCGTSLKIPAASGV